jgi:hypothetical protein
MIPGFGQEYSARQPTSTVPMEEPDEQLPGRKVTLRGFAKRVHKPLIIGATRVGVGARALAHTISAHDAPNPWRIYRVRTDRVEFFQTGTVDDPIYTYGRMGSFDKRKPQIIGGTWDREITPVRDTVVYRGFYERYILGLPWSSTSLHPSRVTSPHPSNGRRWTTRSFEKLTSRYDRLHESMQRLGWVDARPYSSFYDQLALNVSRGGALIRNSSGQHRLVMAILLGIEIIPARFLVLHEEWNGRTADLVEAE